MRLIIYPKPPVNGMFHDETIANIGNLPRLFRWRNTELLLGGNWYFYFRQMNPCTKKFMFEIEIARGLHSPFVIAKNLSCV